MEDYRTCMCTISPVVLETIRIIWHGGLQGIHCCTGNLKGHTICLVHDGRSAVGQLEYMCPAEILH